MAESPEQSPVRMDPALIARCKMPRPTPELYEAMARAGYESNKNDGAMLKVDQQGRGREMNEAWEDLPSDFRDILIAEAKAMYAAVAFAAMHPPAKGVLKASKLKGGTDA